MLSTLKPPLGGIFISTAFEGGGLKGEGGGAYYNLAKRNAIRASCTWINVHNHTLSDQLSTDDTFPKLASTVYKFMPRPV